MKVLARRGRSKGRAINGIVLLNKPKGLTSNRALQQVKHIFDARKAGHTGSLDPLATGMLPICLGEATKVSGFLLEADKRYITRCRLGIRTDSADADGEIIQTADYDHIQQADIEATLPAFRGEIEQMPPMHSALKVNGVPLYKLAHQGQEIERNSRQVRVYDLKLLSFDAPFAEFSIHCSKGTYVRTLVDDIGQTLGCGAHVTELSRLQVGPFTDPDAMYSIEDLERLREQGRQQLDDCLLGLDSALSEFPAVNLSADAAFYLQQGQAVFIPKAKDLGEVRLYTQDNRFFGVGEVQGDGKIAPRRLMGVGN